MEAAAPSASSPSVPGSGVEVPGPLSGGGHQPGTHVQVGPRACAGGVPAAIKAHAITPNITLRMVPPTYFVRRYYLLQILCHCAKYLPALRSSEQFEPQAVQIVKRFDTTVAAFRQWSRTLRARHGRTPLKTVYWKGSDSLGGQLTC